MIMTHFDTFLSTWYMSPKVSLVNATVVDAVVTSISTHTRAKYRGQKTLHKISVTSKSSHI